MSDLYVFHDDNSVFVDYSKDSKDYLRDEYAISFVSLEDSFYIGLYKPFNSVYLELDTAASGMSLSASIEGNSVTLEDDSKDFTRSGFISWEKPSNWAAETINGQSAFWIKLDADADFTATIQGLNIVFADDNDLRQEVREIDKQLAKNDTSFIAYHLASRNEIIQTIRNGGNTKISSNIVKDMDKWDILDRGQIKQAAKYLALSKIFFDVSKNPDDKSYQRFRNYESMFGKAFNLYIMHLDKDDDGIKDVESDLRINSIEIEIL